MKIDAKLTELMRQLSLCIKCKQCTYGPWPENLPICPINDLYKFYTYSGGGIIYLARGILLGLLGKEDYEETLEVLSKCTNCGYCGQTCQLVKVGPPYQNVTDLIRLLRIHLVEQGVFVSEKHKDKIAGLTASKCAVSFTQPEADGLESIRHTAPQKGDILLFAGCVASYKRQEKLQSVTSLLGKLGVDFQLASDEWCCGAPLLDLGDSRGVHEFAEHHLSVIQSAGSKKVIFLCPHCQETFHDIYPQVLGQPFPAELVFIDRYLTEVLADRDLGTLKTFPHKLTYHDPCYLGRYQGDTVSARDLLGRIPGAELKEMKRSRQSSYCCGGGTASRVLDESNCRAVGLQRLREVEGTGTDVLVTSCPHCESQFADLLKDGNKTVSVKDICEVLDECIR
jgi:heterodisulfide reductase subunit D